MSQRFKTVAINPNDAVGGGGCLCSETKNTDCKGPFAVFYHVEMENNLSPHAVLCIQCARDFVYEVDNGEVLAGGETGEPSITEALEVVELPDEDEIPEL